MALDMFTCAMAAAYSGGCCKSCALVDACLGGEGRVTVLLASGGGVQVREGSGRALLAAEWSQDDGPPRPEAQRQEVPVRSFRAKAARLETR